LVEEAAAASESIVSQATQLAALVARWDVADANEREMTPQAARPAVQLAERRSAQRPWKPAAKAPAKAPATAPAKAQAFPPNRPMAAGNDGGWKEF
jgi:methyl-accepting chemotaxis protein